MTKKLSILSLAFAVLLLMTGCGQKAEDQDVNPPATETSDESADENALSEEENVADSGNDLEDSDATEEEEVTPSESEDTGSLPSFDLKVPDIKVVKPIEENDSLNLPSVKPNLDVKVPVPSVDDFVPPLPDPDPSI